MDEGHGQPAAEMAGRASLASPSSLAAAAACVLFDRPTSGWEKDQRGGKKERNGEPKPGSKNQPRVRKRQGSKRPGTASRQRKARQARHGDPHHNSIINNNNNKKGREGDRSVLLLVTRLFILFPLFQLFFWGRAGSATDGAKHKGGDPHYCLLACLHARLAAIPLAVFEIPWFVFVFVCLRKTDSYAQIQGGMYGWVDFCVE